MKAARATAFKVKAENEFGVSVTTDIVTIALIPLVWEDYYQEYIDLWTLELANANTDKLSLDAAKTAADTAFQTAF